MKGIFFSYFLISTIILLFFSPLSSSAQTNIVNARKEKKTNSPYQNLPYKNQIIPSFADTIEELLPTVVNISTSQDQYNSPSFHDDKLQIIEDLKKGGEIASNLKSIYEWSLRSINEARINKSEEKIQEVIDVLIPLYEAWKEIAE